MHVSIQTGLKIDLHLHTIDDPRDRHVHQKPEELIDKAQSLGFKALAITLHGAQFEDPRITEYALERDICLIPGIEQDIEGFHVLLINFPKSVAESIKDFPSLKKAKAENRLVIAAHPFFPGSICLGDLVYQHADCLDALEVSGFFHSTWNPNRKAIEASKKLNLPLVANSDTHCLEQFGLSYSVVEAEANPESIVASIKAGKINPITQSLQLKNLSSISYKVIGRGYMPWIDYQRKRGHNSIIQRED